MIDWKTMEEVPEDWDNHRIIIQLKDGRVCSGRVNKDGGFGLEYVDNVDVVANLLAGDIKWAEI